MIFLTQRTFSIFSGRSLIAGTIFALASGTASAVTLSPIDFSNKNRMVIFGDSLSDFGNTGTVQAAYQNWSEEANLVLPDVPGWPSPYENTRRFTNGNMWSVYFAQNVQAFNNPGFQAIPNMDAARALPYNPYIGHSAEAPDDILGYNVGGVYPNTYASNPASNGSIHQNWAWGGAQTNTSPLVTTDFTLPYDDGYYLQSVHDQITQFALTGNTFDSGSVAFLWAGANDYILYSTPTSPGADIWSHIAGSATPPTDLGVTAANNQLQNIQALIDLGVENIVLMNLPDISKTPGAMAGDFDGASTTLSPSDYVNQFNSTLAAGLVNLEGDANIAFVDIFTALNQIIADPEAYGLNSSYIAESVILNEHQYSDIGFNPQVTQEQIDSNDFEGWLFWDHVHPTEEGHALLGQVIYNSAAVPEPGAFLLVAMAGGLLLGRRRKRH